MGILLKFKLWCKQAHIRTNRRRKVDYEVSHVGYIDICYRRSRRCIKNTVLDLNYSMPISHWSLCYCISCVQSCILCVLNSLMYSNVRMYYTSSNSYHDTLACYQGTETEMHSILYVIMYFPEAQCSTHKVSEVVCFYQTQGVSWGGIVMVVYSIHCLINWVVVAVCVKDIVVIVVIATSVSW